MAMISLANSRAALFAAGAAAMLAIGAVGTTPAEAQQKVAAAVGVNTNCAKWKPGVLMSDTECTVKRAAKLQAVNTCLRKIKSALDAGKTTRAKLGAVTNQNACKIAARFG